jgi:hypothetical protein
MLWQHNIWMAVIKLKVMQLVGLLTCCPTMRQHSHVWRESDSGANHNYQRSCAMLQAWASIDKTGRQDSHCWCSTVLQEAVLHSNDLYCTVLWGEVHSIVLYCSAPYLWDVHCVEPLLAQLCQSQVQAPDRAQPTSKVYLRASKAGTPKHWNCKHAS